MSDTLPLEQELDSLRIKRRRILRDLDENDTEIIGVRLELDKRKEQNRQILESERGFERSELFDD